MRKLTMFGALAVLAVLVGTLGLLLVGPPVSATVGVNCATVTPIKGNDTVEDNLDVFGGTTCILRPNGTVEGNVYVGNVAPNNIFDMSGGTVEGYVNLDFGDTFNLSRGTVEGDVYVAGTFNMSGGTVEGDVELGITVNGSTFNMSGGTVEGDVICDGGTFIRSGGTVEGNVIGCV